MPATRTLFISRAAYFVFLAAFTFAAAEVILRVYNPFAPRTKGDKIVLPVNRAYDVIGGQHTKNSIGFRGPEKPEHFEEYLSIITVGGSTTECSVLPDNATWPAKLGQRLNADIPKIWLNNAGLDGHSTFGHRILLEDYLIDLKPRILIFLVGINDVGRSDLKDHDRNNIIDAPPTWIDWFARKSEVANLVLAYKRTMQAERAGLTYRKLNINDEGHLKVSNERANTELDRHREIAAAYGSRLFDLVEKTKGVGIEPILVTQPSLLGVGVDETTGTDLESVRAEIEMSGEINGKLYWEILELYNDQTRIVGKKTETMVVDLANLLPKNSLYFVDWIHFSETGADKVAEILYSEVVPFLKSRQVSTVHMRTARSNVLMLAGHTR